MDRALRCDSVWQDAGLGALLRFAVVWWCCCWTCGCEGQDAAVAQGCGHGDFRCADG